MTRPTVLPIVENPTTGDLYKAKTVLEDDVVAAADAFMGDPNLTTFLVGDGYAIDLHAAVSASSFALGMLAKPEAKLTSKRAAVRTAILLARPSRP